MKHHYGCPVQGTINTVSGKWKVLAIWHLGFSPRRFAELRKLLPGISEKVLTAQLRQLERPINILYRERELAHILTDAEPAAVVSATEFASPAPIWNPKDLGREAAGLPDERPHVSVDGDTPAGIIYTSGTTGVSKGAILTHNNIAANALNLLACWQISAPIAFCSPCRSSMCTAWATGCIAGSSAAAASVCSNGSNIRKRPASSSISGRRCSSACPRCTSGYWTCRPSSPRNRRLRAAVRFRQRAITSADL